MQRVNPVLPNLMAEAKPEAPAVDIVLNADQKDTDEFTEYRKSFYFNLPPPDLQEKLFGYLDYKCATSLRPLSLFPAILNQKLVHEVVLTVQQGDMAQTKALIQQNPALSSFKGTAMDYSGRTIRDVTPFQAALCALDIEMCDMLRRYMAPCEVLRQYQEVFPEGHEKYFASQASFDFNFLIGVIAQSSNAEIVAALANQEADLRLCQALNRFRVAFTKRSQEEKVFNPEHLIKVLQLFGNFSQWSRNQLDLFWRQVVGYVQRFLPANITQDVAQGLFQRVVLKEKARRSFNFRLGGGSILNLDFNTHAVLGFYWAAAGGRSYENVPRGDGVSMERLWFGRLMLNKSSSLVALRDQYQSAPSSVAVNSVK